MRKLLVLSAVLAILPGAALAQSPGEILGAAATKLPADVFNCRRGKNPCDLRVRMYSELDPTDFYGSANPVDGYPKFVAAKQQYVGDVQIQGNYPASFGFTDLNWYSVWDGVTDADAYNHVGYYGSQSQVVTVSEIGNQTTSTCLPVVAQIACFLALTPLTSQDSSSFGPAGSIVSAGGLSAIPRPDIMSTSNGQVDIGWDEATTATINDGAPHPILGYRLLFAVRSPTDPLGPSETELAAEEMAGTLIDATPGTFIPRTTTSFTLQATDPILAGFDPATQGLVAVIRLVYAEGVESLHYSSNSFPFGFSDVAGRVTDFRARLDGTRVILNWSVDGLAGIRSFSVSRSDQAQGSYYPISRQDITVNGARATFDATNILKGRLRGRGGADSLFFRLEVNGLDGSRVLLAPIEIDVRSARRTRGVH
ncbi:MAG: hypothetical protein ACE5IK_04310 [Acidobacteriota bacterium]